MSAVMEMSVQILEMRRQERVMLEGLLGIQNMVAAGRDKNDIIEAIDTLIDEYSSDDLTDEVPNIELCREDLPNGEKTSPMLEVAWLLNPPTQNWWDCPAEMLEAQMLAAAKRVHSNRLLLQAAKDERDTQDKIANAVVVGATVNVGELITNEKAHKLALTRRDAAQDQISQLKNDIASDENYLIDIIPEVTTVRLLDVAESQWWTVSWIWDDGFTDGFTVYINREAVPA